MSDTFVPVQNPAVTDSKLDGELVTVSGTPVIRERIQVAGLAAAAIASVLNAAPTTEYGVVTRNIPSGTQPVSIAATVTVDTELPAAAALTDALANPTTPQIGADTLQWDPGATKWERVQGNVNVTVLASGARTTTQTQADQTSPNHRGIAVILDITAYTAGSLTVDIQGKDPASGKYVSLLASAAVVATGTTVYRVYPGLTAAANLVANDHLWRTWRIVITVGDATSITYSVGAVLLR